MRDIRSNSRVCFANSYRRSPCKSFKKHLILFNGGAFRVKRLTDTSMIAWYCSTPFPSNSTNATSGAFPWRRPRIFVHVLWEVPVANFTNPFFWSGKWVIFWVYQSFFHQSFGVKTWKFFGGSEVRIQSPEDWAAAALQLKIRCVTLVLWFMLKSMICVWYVLFLFMFSFDLNPQMAKVCKAGKGAAVWEADYACLEAPFHGELWANSRDQGTIQTSRDQGSNPSEAIFHLSFFGTYPQRPSFS